MALCLDVKEDERIIIDGGVITITLEKCRSGSAKLVINAPKHITIDRESVHISKLDSEFAEDSL